jgi:hypothetical protein
MKTEKGKKMVCGQTFALFLGFAAMFLIVLLESEDGRAGHDEHGD